MRTPRKAAAVSELEGLISAARQLGLPLPRPPVKPLPRPPVKPLQQSDPPCLGLPGSSPKSGSPLKPSKRPSSSSGGAVSDAGEEKGRSRRRRCGTAAPHQVIGKSRDGDRLAAEQMWALSESYRQLHVAHVAAGQHISQLQGELGHWHGQAQSLASEAQQLRHRLALCEMQLATQQRLHAAQAESQALQGLLQPGMLPLQGWGAVPLPLAVPSGSQPAPFEPFGAEQPLPTAGLPSCTGLPTPCGPLPTCDDMLDDILLPDFPL